MAQDVSNETSIKLWDNIKDNVTAILPQGATVSMSPATGTLTVVATPAAMRRVAAYIEEQNARITRQVTVSVKVLRVDLSDTYDLGLDLGVVFQQLAGQYSINLAGPAPTSVSGAASYLIHATQNASGGGHWASGTATADTTRAVVDALQTAGNVSLVTESSVTTLNGQSAPVSVARQQSYVASTATTVTGTTSSTQTQITPGTLVTGFNMQVLPRVLEDGHLLLQYALSLSDLNALTDYESNGTKVQLPDVNVRSFLQQAIFQSGDTLVLAGYQSTTDKLNDNGLPGIGASIFGGSVSTAKSRSIIVITITPQILGKQNEKAT
jgi:type IVB pilus formation R64 PilN family outer membrane protein